MIQRLVRLFVAAPATAGADDHPGARGGWLPPAAPVRPRSVVVVAAPGCAAAAGAAVALALAAEHASAAVVATWSPALPAPPDGPTPPPLLATARARRLAIALGEGARARGRLVTIAFDPDPERAAGAAHRLLGGDAPAVLVVDGPRPDAFTPVLGGADRIVIATRRDAPPALVDLGLTDAARIGRATAHLVVDEAPALLTASGVVVPPALRLAVQRALH